MDAEKFHRSRDEMLELDPQLASINDEIRTLGMQKLERAMNGQNSELIDQLMQKLSVRHSARLEAINAKGYLCDTCRDTGFVDGRYCNCLRARIYVEHYGAINPLRARGNLDTYDLSIFDDEAQINEYGDTQKSVVRIALNIAKAIASNRKGGGPGLFLYGAPGLGKTWLISALARQAAENGIDTAFIHAVPLFRAYHRERLGHQVEMSYLENAQLLILDDLGAEALTAHVTGESLLALLTYRTENRLTTVITTNLSEGDLASRYGERIASRIRSRELNSIQMKGNDLRDHTMW